MALLLSVGAVFAVPIATQFRFVSGDRLDGLIQASIFEHWFNVLRGHAAWDMTNYFHPYRGTLAYNDGYMLYGIVYAGFRSIGVDPFLASEAVFVALRVLGFVTAYRFVRRALGLRPYWATFGAAMFTLSISVFQQSAHSQILSISLAPGAALLALSLLQALEAGRRGVALGWGVALVMLGAAWLMTAFYMAWLLAFFAVLLLFAFAVLNTAWRARARLVLRREWPVIAAVGVIAAVAVTPFLVLYLPKARESGMHSFAALRPFLPNLADTVRFGPGNLLFGWADHFLVQPGSAERIVGWPPVHIACFIAAVLSWRRWPAGRPAIAAIGAVYLLTLSRGRLTGWWLVYELVPGARAIRVVTRAWIMLAGPVLCVVLVWLQRLGDRRPAMAAILAVLLVAEQLSTGPNVAKLDRPHELDQLNAMLPPPTECRSFAVLSARLDDPEYDTVLQTISANANAMLLAEVARLPTINGISTFNPPDWNAADPSSASYVQRISAYVRAHGLQQVCGVDLRTGRWYRDLSDYRPLHLGPPGGPLSFRKDEAGAALLGDGWYGPEPWGRWGEPRSSLRFLPQGGQGALSQGALSMTLWALADAQPPSKPHRVTVMANGRTAATWDVSAVPAAYHAVLQPPDNPRDAYEVSFIDEDTAGADSNQPAGGGRRLGLGVIAVQLDWP